MPSDLVVGDVAILLGKMLEQQDRVSRTKMAESIPEKIPMKPRREPVRGPLSRGSRDGMLAGRAGHATSLRRFESEAGLVDGKSGQSSRWQRVFLTRIPSTRMAAPATLPYADEVVGYARFSNPRGKDKEQEIVLGTFLWYGK